MQGVRLQSGRTQVFLKKMFPIFVCLGKLWVECKGCHGNPPPLVFFFTDWSHGIHILEATANSSHAGSYLGALSALERWVTASLGAKGVRVCISCLSGRTPP